LTVIDEIDNMLRDLQRIVDGEMWFFGEDGVSPPAPSPQATYHLKKAIVELEQAKLLMEKP
jgi:hypothetical protein